MAIALDATEEAFALVAGTSDPWTETFVTITRIMSLFFSGRRDQLQELLPIAEEASRRSTDGWSAAIVALVRGVVAQFDGDPERTEQSLWEAVRRFEAVGDEFSLAIALTEASEIVEMYGDYDAAHDMLARGIDLSERVGFSVKLLAMRVRLANVETLRGNVERAEQMHLDLLTEIADEAVPWLRTMSYIGLATIARRTQRPERATSWIEQAWAISRARDAPIIQGAGPRRARVHRRPARTPRAAVDHQRHGLAIALAHSTPRGLANSMEGMAGALAIAPDRSLHDVGRPPARCRRCAPSPIGWGDAARRAVRRRPCRAARAGGRWGIRHSRRSSRSAPAATSKTCSTRSPRCSDQAATRTSAAGQREVRHGSVGVPFDRPVSRDRSGPTPEEPPMSKILYRWGKAAAQHPWRMIGAWLVIAVAVIGLNASVGGETSDDFTIPGTEAQQGIDLLDERFPTQGGVSGQIVFADPDGDITDPAARAADRRDARRVRRRTQRARRDRSVRSGQRVRQRRRSDRLRDGPLQRRPARPRRGQGGRGGRRDRTRRRPPGRAVAHDRAAVPRRSRAARWSAWPSPSSCCSWPSVR